MFCFVSLFSFWIRSFVASCHLVYSVCLFCGDEDDNDDDDDDDDDDNNNNNNNNNNNINCYYYTNMSALKWHS